MRLTPWLSLFSKSPARRNLSSVKTKRRSVIDNLEQLEDRLLLSSFYVATTGDDTTGLGTAVAPYRSIQKALDVASLDGSSPHTINVAGGTYNQLGFDNGFGIGSSASPKPNLDGVTLDGGWDATFTTQTFGSTIYIPQTQVDGSTAFTNALTSCITVYNDGATIRGFTFVFDGVLGDGGTRVTSGIQTEAQSVVIAENTIEVGHATANPRPAGVTVHSSAGSSAAGVQVTNNTIVANGGTTTTSATNVTGIFVNPDAVGRVTPIIISGNNISGQNLGVGIAIDRLSYVNVIGNTIQRTGGTAISSPLIDLRQATAATGPYGSSQTGINITNNILDGFAPANNTGIDLSARNSATQQVTGVNISNNFVTNVTTGIRGNQATVIGSGVNATDNSFVNIASFAVDFSGATGTMNASRNWYGSNVLATVTALINGSVDYTPYLNLGTDTSGSTGFQPDYSDLTVVATGGQTGVTGRIQEGIILLADGSLTGSARKIAVTAGTYAESVSITKGLILDGVGATTIIDPPATGDGITISPATAVTVSNLRVTGAGSALVANGQTILNLINFNSDGNTSGGSITNVPTVNVTGSTANDTLTADFDDFSGSVGALFQSISYSGVTSVVLNGDTGVDTFNITPAATTTITVNGNAPTTTPGDVLNLNMTATTSPQVNTTGPASGNATSTGNQTVFWTGIENLNSTFPPMVPNDVTIGTGSLPPGTQDGVADNYVLSVVNGQLVVTVNGTIVFGSTLGTVNSLIIDGTNDDDTFTIDLTGGNPLPAGGITFNGGANGAGGDTLVVKGSGQSAIYTPSQTTFGSGVVLIGTSPINFTGLEPVDITGMATVTVASPPAPGTPLAADNDLTITNGFDSATGLIPALVITGTTNAGGTAIESLHLWNNTTIIIDTTVPAGTDHIIVASANNAHGNTNLTIDTGNQAGDTVAINGSATFSGTVTLTSTSISQTAGTLSAGTLSLSGGTASLDSVVTATTLTVTNTLANLSLTGSGTVITNTFSPTNTGTLTLGNADADTLTFNGGLNTTSVGGVVSLRGQISSSDDALTFGAITLSGGTTVLDTNAATTAGDITLGAVTGGGFNLTLATGAIAGASVSGTSVSGVGTLTITQSDTTTFSGAVGATTITLTDTNGAITFQDNVTATTLNTAAQGYSAVFQGSSNTITNAVTFSNTGGVTLGNGSDVFLFDGGLVSTASTTTLNGTVRSSADAIQLGALTLAGNSTVDSTNNGGSAAGAAIDFSTIAGGGFSLVVNGGTGGNVTFNGALTNLLNVDVDGAAIDLNAKLTATGTVRLTGTDDVTIDGAIDPTTVTIQSDDDVSINASVVASVSITVEAGLDGTGGVTVTNAGSLAVSGAGTVDISTGATSGDVSVQGPVTSVSGPITVTATAGSITEAGAGKFGTTGLLTTTSATGQTLGGANTVGSFNATNMTSGNISLTNTAATLTVTGITQTGGGISVSNTGNLTTTDVVLDNTAGNAISLTATSGNLTLDAAVTGTGSDTIALTTLTSGNILVNAAVSTGSGAITMNSVGNVSLAAATSTTGSVDITGININSTGAGTITTGTGLTLTNTGTASTLNGVISGAGNVTKEGTGTILLHVANNYTGVTNVNNGTLALDVDGALGTVAGNTIVNAGGTLDVRNTNYATLEALNLNGGTLQTSIGTSIWTGTVSLTASSTVDVTGTQLTISGVISGAVGNDLAKTGGGILVLPVGTTHTYAGITDVYAGTLYVNGINSGTGAVNVRNSAILGGTGTITGSVNVLDTSRLSPGVNGPGRLTIVDSLTFGTNAFFDVELNGLTSGTQYDQVEVQNGTVDLGGVSGATLVPTLGFGAQPYDRFTLINKLSAGAVTGTYEAHPEGSVYTLSATRLRVSYIEFHNPGSVPPTPIFYGDGNDVSLTVMTPPILVTQGVNGDLTFDGTGWNDDITLSFTGTNQLTVIGNDVSNFTGPGTTNIQLAGPYTVTGNITVRLGNGKDKVLIRGVGAGALYSSGDLTIDLGSDDDAVTTIDNALAPIATAGLSMTGSLNIIGGAGLDNITLGSDAANDTITALNVNIDTGTGAGNQTISLDRFTANGNVTLANGGAGAQTVSMGANASAAPNSIRGNLIINQLASASGYTVGVRNTSVGGFVQITNGNGSGAAAVTINTTTSQTIGGSTTITNGNNLTNAVSLIGNVTGPNLLKLTGNVTVKNGNAGTSNTITVTDIVNSGTTSSAFTNGSSPANTITFSGADAAIPYNSFLGVVTATNGASSGANIINATRLSSAKGINLVNGTATTSNDVAIGGAGAADLVSVTGNLVITNGASADIDVDINNLTTLGANAVGNVTMTNEATGAGGTTVTLGASALNSISGNLQITNQASTGLRSLVMNRTTVSGRNGVNLYNLGAGDTSVNVGNNQLVTIAKGLVIEDGTGAAAVNLLNLTTGGLNYKDLGGGVDTLNLADTAGTLRVNGVTRIDTADGSDTVQIATTGRAIFNDTVFIALGDGNDLLFIGANADSPAFNGASKFQFNGGAGTDTFNASPLSIAEYDGEPLKKKVKSKILNFENLLTN